MTREELAKEIGVDHTVKNYSIIAQIEKGAIASDCYRIQAIAKALKVRMLDLIPPSNYIAAIAAKDAPM